MIGILIRTIFFTNSQHNDTQQLAQFFQTIDYSLFKSGDLIFRQGDGILSQTVLSHDRSSEFSHVGIIKMISKQPHVIHASTGNPVGVNAIVKMETIEEFLQNSSYSAALYRLKQDHANLGNNAASLAYQYSLKQIPFDAQFSLASKDRLYCTELVWRVYLQLGIDLVKQNFSTLSFPLEQKLYILPSNLLSSKYIHQIHRFELQK